MSIGSGVPIGMGGFDLGMPPGMSILGSTPGNINNVGINNVGERVPEEQQLPTGFHLSQRMPPTIQVPFPPGQPSFFPFPVPVVRPDLPTPNDSQPLQRDSLTPQQSQAHSDFKSDLPSDLPSSGSGLDRRTKMAATMGVRSPFPLRASSPLSPHKNSFRRSKPLNSNESLSVKNEPKGQKRRFNDQSSFSRKRVEGARRRDTLSSESEDAEDGLIDLESSSSSAVILNNQGQQFSTLSQSSSSTEPAQSVQVSPMLRYIPF